MTGDTDETDAGDDDTGDAPPADDADDPGDDDAGTSDVPGGSGGSGGDGPGGRGGSDGPGGPGGPDDGGDEPYRRDVDPERVEYLAAELADLREEVEGLESRVEDKTVHRDDIEAELRRYVRARQRKGHATGWGPYLVLLYGVLMTLGAFYYLGGVWAVLAMVIVWLSTLGLYVVMAVFSTGITVTRRVAALRNVVRRFR
ncbi:MAG: ribonuclease BN [Haloarculaceae archaeon]